MSIYFVETLQSINYENENIKYVKCKILDLKKEYKGTK